MKQQQPIQEVFLERDWEDEAEARQLRDARAVELEAQGLMCICHNLYTVEGDRVFVVEATEAEPVEVSAAASERRERRRDERRDEMRKGYAKGSERPQLRNPQLKRQTHLG